MLQRPALDVQASAAGLTGADPGTAVMADLRRRLMPVPGKGTTKQEGTEKVLAAYVIVTVITIVANAWAAVADLVRARFVLANMEEVGVPESWLAPLGVLKSAGAAGLLVGLLGLRPVGIAAAIGLVLFFTGALATHIRTHVLYNIAFPGAYFALAIASAALAVAAR